MIPSNLPPNCSLSAGSKAGVVGEVVLGPREIHSIVAGRNAELSAGVIEGCTLKSTLGCGHGGTYGGAKRKLVLKMQSAVDTLGHPMALSVTPADNQDLSKV